MRIVWIFGTTVKGASLHRLSSTWAELSRKARYSAVPLHSPTPWRQGRRRRQGRQDAVPCSAIQEITKIVETCWSSVSECVWMGWSLCTVSLFLLENVTVQWLLYCLHNDKMILQSPCKWCFPPDPRLPLPRFCSSSPTSPGSFSSNGLKLWVATATLADWDGIVGIVSNMFQHLLVSGRCKQMYADVTCLPA